MRSETDLSDASRQYAAAYAAHYTDRDLPAALRLYKQVMASHPCDPEAEYCRMQIQNIINAAIPKQVLLEAKMKLATDYIEDNGTLGAKRFPAEQIAAPLPT